MEQMKDLSDWRVALRYAVRMYLEQTSAASQEHIKDTPRRVVEMWEEFASGYTQYPKTELLCFDDVAGYNGMLHVWGVPVVSVCAHHIVPIIGTAHFAYIPDKRVVGLSKIPRMVNILSARHQIQEGLTDQIVDTFFTSEVHPKGCAVTITAVHCCMAARGIRQHGLVTQTTSLRGVMSKGEPRQEFLGAVEPKSIVL
jgi:GTP cyclohydrolase I